MDVRASPEKQTQRAPRWRGLEKTRNNPAHAVYDLSCSTSIQQHQSTLRYSRSESHRVSCKRG